MRRETKRGKVLTLAVVVLVTLASVAQVANLDGHVFGNHAVPGSQITVDDVVVREVRHPVRYLGRHPVQLFHEREVELGTKEKTDFVFWAVLSIDEEMGI